ncbi:MAG: (2Fe-2S) ferredoxin domain-containing protein [Limnochordia bacterium]|jgi:NADP-reducing hydrogenase subunit HndB
MASVEDLKRIKEETLGARRGNLRIMVGMGVCGIAAGARQIMATIVQELGKWGVTHIPVEETGCMGLCSQEPMVQIIAGDGTRVIYGPVDVQQARQIVAYHVMHGQLING